MSKCVYEFQGHSFNSQAAYNDFISREGPRLYKKYGDLVFSQFENCVTCDQLDRIAKDAATYQSKYQEAKKNLIYTDGEDTLRFEAPYIGVTSFLSGLRNKDNKLLSPEFVEVEYWKKRVKEWKDPDKGFDSEELALFGNSVTITDSVTDRMLEDYIEQYAKGNKDTDNQVLQLIRQVKEKWQAQGEIGTAIHDVLRRLFSKVKTGKNQGQLVIDQPDSFLINTYFNSSRPNPLYDTKKLTQDQLKDIIEYAKKLKQELHNQFGKNLSFLPEFQIVSKLDESVPGKGDTIMGIIDLLVVDQDGNAHVIDYKTSPRDTFNSAKERGFWYQLGLYNRMLQNAGIRTNSRSPQVMVAPIKMEGFRKEGDEFVMDRVVQRDVDLLSDITTRSTLNEVARNLDDFIPLTIAENLTPQEMLEQVNLFESKAFPGISTSKTWTDEEIKRLIDSSGGFILDPKTNKYTITIKNSNIAPFTADSEGELFDKVKEFYTVTLPRKRKDVIGNVLYTLRNGIKQQTNEVEFPKTGMINIKEGASSSWFKNLLGKYCSKEYELIENDALKQYGIILIKNRGTRQIDVLQVTSDNLDFEHMFSDSNNRKLLTGAFEVDNIQARKPNSLALQAKNGNIHLMEVMAILNCIPSLANSGVLGEIMVVNPYSLQGMSASNEELTYNFNELSSHVEGFRNNISQFKFATKVELANNRFKQILKLGEITDWQDNKYKIYKNYTSLATDLDSAINESNKNLILRKLDELRIELEKKKPTDIDVSLDTYNEADNVHKSLYYKVLLAIAEVKGIQFRQQTKDNQKWLESMNFARNGVQSLMIDNPGNLNNETLNLLTKLVTEAYQNVREDVSREAVAIRELVNDLKKDKGFNKAVEMTGGNATNLFKNMIEYKNGDILFKNPWDPKFAGSQAEKKFLEYTLTKINENRFSNMTEQDVERMKVSLDPRYYRVPLAVGSSSSQVSQAGGLFSVLKDKLKKLNPLVWKQEVQKLYNKTQERLTGVFSDPTGEKEGNLFEMNNMFDGGEDPVHRLEKIQEKGVEYFEANLETLLLKHIFAYSSKKHIDTIMPMAKASMVHLISQGHLSNKKFTNATNYVSDYIKNKIKNESLLPENMKSVNTILAQLRSAASILALGFSPVSYGYQMIQGLWTDIRLGFQGKGDSETPFTFENFRQAASQVYRDFFKLGNKPTKCSLLNEFYGLNDMDMNTYADKIKSDKYGIYNISNLAFHCSSRPDFFNRMMIFVTQMKKDGTWDAYSVDSKGKLQYDWKKDKRFEVYANNQKSDPKYNEQKGLYYALAEQLEREHALNADGTYFRVGQALPKAYTNQQMESYKSLSDDIYGYYAHEKKSMIHATTLGALWMQMRTFWSGKKNQYLGRRGVRLQGRYVQQRDSQGNLLYQKEENGKMIPTVENTGLPLVKWEGQWQEGIFLTIHDLIVDGTHNGFRQSFNDMWYNEDEQMRNLYRSNIKQLLYDLAMFAMIGSLITGAMMDWDDELTKEAKSSNDLGMAVVAAAAHMAMKMVSSSFGDFNFIESIGSPLYSWQPFSFQFVGRNLVNIYETAFGDKDFGDTLFRMTGATSNSKVFWDVLRNQ